MYYKYLDKTSDIQKYIGDMSQVAGIKSYRFLDGKSNGIRAVDFWTGTGLNFTALLDRCLDISQATYTGKSLCWRSPAREVHPHLFETQGVGWKDGFFGGLLTTCGLTYLGAPCVDQEEILGLHGKISYVPAENVKITQEWQKSEYILSVEGSMKHVSVFGENLVLIRKLKTWLNKSEILIEDKVENIGFKESPFMILYHINVGSKQEILKLVRRFADAGKCAIFISSEFEEITQICDRVLILKDGVIINEYSRNKGTEITEESLMRAIQ